MNKDAALHAFFSSFGLTAYPSTSVPTSGDEMPEFPYLTYTPSTDSDLNRLMIAASVWYRSESWAGINQKVRQISQYVGEGVVLPCDEGGLIVRKGTPFAQSLGDDSDNMVKRKILNFEFLYATVY